MQNEHLQEYINITGDRYDFLAFSADKLSNFTPYLEDLYRNLINIWGSYSSEIQIAFFISSLILFSAVVYLVFRLIESVKKHRNIHVHHYAGFGGEDEN